MSWVIDQLQLVLGDQLKELEDIRSQRHESLGRVSELDAREIEVLIGISKTKNLIEIIKEKREHF